jgi:RNA polymerase sigma-70 factor (ECF subfamily)
MDEHASFADVMARLRSGEDAAAAEVFERFSGRLLALARRQFDSALRHKIDPEDVVQSAYKSFFVRFGIGKFELGDWGGLWGLLTLITLRKCADRVAYHRAERRNLAREAAPPANASGVWWEGIDREPTPDEAVVFAEAVERLLGDLDADERPIVEMSLQGYTVPEISRQLGRAERSVRRLRERVRVRVEQMQLEGIR